MEEDPLTVDSTIKDADSPEDFIQEILAQYNTTFGEYDKRIAEMLDAPDGMFSEGEQNKLIKWKDYV